MSDNEKSLLELTRRYFEFRGDPAGTIEELSQFLSPDVTWQEMPNQMFAPEGRIYGFEDMLKDFQMAQQYTNPQKYTIENILVEGDRVALQANWQGHIAQAMGPFAAGDQLTCQVAIFLKFQDGKVLRQVEYPSYPPLSKTDKS